MKTLMYPIAPEDDFPETFCAIRAYSGEHHFYVPEHGSAGACLWELHEALMDRDQTVTYVPETRLLEAMDEAREAGRRADMAERVAADRKGLCDSLRETNDDLRRIIDEMKDTERLDAENVKLRDELAKWERLAAGIDLPEYPVTQFKPKDLERENAKLREQSERLFDKTLELATENTKLRGLVKDMWHLMDGSGVTTGAWGRCVQILDRMREIGIEV